jgi:hypothetical protein
MDIINRLGIEAAIRVIGSFNKLLSVIGKQNFYEFLVENGFDPKNDIKLLGSYSDIPVTFNYGPDQGTFNLMVLNHPVYLLRIKGLYYLFQPPGPNKTDKKNLWISSTIGRLSEEYFLNMFGFSGIDFNKVIDLFYNQD